MEPSETEQDNPYQTPQLELSADSTAGPWTPTNLLFCLVSVLLILTTTFLLSGGHLGILDTLSPDSPPGYGSDLLMTFIGSLFFSGPISLHLLLMFSFKSPHTWPRRLGILATSVVMCFVLYFAASVAFAIVCFPGAMLMGGLGSEAGIMIWMIAAAVAGVAAYGYLFYQSLKLRF